MMEIKLCRHNEIAGQCHDRVCRSGRKGWVCRCGITNTAKTSNLYFSCWKCGLPKEEPRSRACSDCNQYALETAMITQKDGRVTCKRCDRAAKDKASDRAQLDFFGQLSLI